MKTIQTEGYSTGSTLVRCGIHGKVESVRRIDGKMKIEVNWKTSKFSCITEFYSMRKLNDLIRGGKVEVIAEKD